MQGECFFFVNFDGLMLWNRFLLRCVAFFLFSCFSKSGLDEAEFSKLHANAKRGDIVGVTGFPGLCSLSMFF